MASFYDITVGQQVEFQRVLASAGFTDSDISRIIRRPNLASTMYAAIHPQAGQRFPWYTHSPEEQLRTIATLNSERDWGFVASDFPAVPEEVTLMPDEVLSLAVYLPGRGQQSGLQRTVEELWDSIPEKIGEYTKWRWDEFKTNPRRLRLAPHSDGTKRRWKPGIRWVVIDLANGVDESVESVLQRTSATDPYQPAGVELLALCRLQPRWVLHMDKDEFPYALMSGLQFYDDKSWSWAPCLRRWDIDTEVELSAVATRASGPGWSSPLFREC